MGKKSGLVMIATLFVLFNMANPAYARDLYVSPIGNDSASGTSSEPLKSLQGARDKIRSLNIAGHEPINIYFRSGTYAFSAPVTFEPQDSGTATNPITYQGYQEEKVLLSGGFKLEGWTVANGHWQTTIPSGYPIPRQLFINGARATRAKTTVTGWTKVLDYGYQTSSPLAVTHAEDIEVVSIPDDKSWHEERCGIQSKQGNKITMKQPCWNGAQTGHHPIGVPTWLENASEFLDQPGEWFADPRSRKITYIPRSSQSITTSNLIIPTIEHLIVFEGTESSPVQYLNFRNLTLQHTAWNDENGPSSDKGFFQSMANYSAFGARSPSGAIEGEYISHLSLTSLTISHTGGSGIVYKNGTKDSIISSSVIRDLSGMGIEIGRQMAKTVSTSKQTTNVSINNNYITQIGQEFRGAPGIYVGYTKNMNIKHNTIFDIPYTGIGIGHRGFSFASNNHISNNLIVDHMQVLFDGGGIYNQGPQPGTIIEKNVILKSTHYMGGIYLDEGSQYITVRNNGLVDNHRSVFDNGGSNNFINNYWKDPQVFNNSYFQNLCTPDATTTQAACGPDTYPTTGANANHVINGVNGIPATLYNNAGVSCQFRNTNLENLLKLPISRSACTTPTPTSQGDLNRDNLVDQKDVTLLKSKFGNPYTIFDYNKIITNWGK